MNVLYIYFVRYLHRISLIKANLITISKYNFYIIIKKASSSTSNKKDFL